MRQIYFGEILDDTDVEFHSTVYSFISTKLRTYRLVITLPEVPAPLPFNIKYRFFVGLSFSNVFGDNIEYIYRGKSRIRKSFLVVRLFLFIHLALYLIICRLNPILFYFLSSSIFCSIGSIRFLRMLKGGGFIVRGEVNTRVYYFPEFF